MKNKKAILSLVLLLPLLSVAQTDIYAPVLEQIARNNGQLAVARSLYDATATENSVGLAPENPEVEFGYLIGNKASGNRKDVKITQSFDFPSVYSHRSALQKQRTNTAALQLQSEKRDLMLQAKELLIELLYNNAMHKLCSLQTDTRLQLVDTYSALAEKGEATDVDLNKARLSHELMQAELSSFAAEQQRLLDELRILNGGQPVSFSETEFPKQMLPADFETWIAENQHKNPDLLMLDSEIKSGQTDIKLARAETLPKFSVGYQGEFVSDAPFQGVVVGLSIPLWENRNKVRAAKSRHQATVIAADNALATYTERMRMLFNQAKTLERIENSCNDAIAANPLTELLDKQLQYGQIPLTDYLFELQECQQANRQLLDIRRQLALVLAKLNANL